MKVTTGVHAIGKARPPPPAPHAETETETAEIIELGEDLVEEVTPAPTSPAHARAGAAAGGGVRITTGERRHRRATVSSPIPAQLAASMTRVCDDETPIPAARVHDEITAPVGAAYPRGPNAEVERETDTEPETDPDMVPGDWIDVIAEPDPSVLTGPGVAARARCLPSLDLRGVFRADAAVVAADLSLPDELFVLPGRDRARPAPAASRATSHAPSAAASGAPRLAPSPGGGGDAVAARPQRPPSRRPPEETLPRGAIIDKYRIDRLLGKGGFAAVYRATHLLLGTQVALKLLRPQVLARHPHLAKLLYEEARFAARIDHPNVVKVFDVTHSASITYIVMEYIDGRSLADTIARERALPWPRVVEIGAAVAAGLKVALGARLIHRDIKPANILLGRRGEIKIVDLGLVLRAGPLPLGAEPVGAEPGDPALGRRATIGTYGYMAPEQAVDPERVDFRADIYALGATLYEATVGAPPFPIGDHARCIEMHAREPPPPPEARRPSLPPALSALLLRMLAKKPDDRFPSYDALIDELARLAAVSGR